MRRFVVHIILFQIILGTQLYGWGYDVHRRISRAAVQAVTGEFGDFLNNNINDLSIMQPILIFGNLLILMNSHGIL